MLVCTHIMLVCTRIGLFRVWEVLVCTRRSFFRSRELRGNPKKSTCGRNTNRGLKLALEISLFANRFEFCPLTQSRLPFGDIQLDLSFMWHWNSAEWVFIFQSPLLKARYLRNHNLTLQSPCEWMKVLRTNWNYIYIFFFFFFFFFFSRLRVWWITTIEIICLFNLK